MKREKHRTLESSMLARFHARGQAAWECYQRTGVSVPAADVLVKLQAKLDAKRKALAGEPPGQGEDCEG